jgi:hypothetical protein
MHKGDVGDRLLSADYPSSGSCLANLDIEHVVALGAIYSELFNICP